MAKAEDESTCGGMRRSEISDAGKTKVEVPEGVRKLLEKPASEKTPEKTEDKPGKAEDKKDP